MRKLLIVWLLTGVWHGAGYNFLLWGAVLFTVIVIDVPNVSLSADGDAAEHINNDVNELADQLMEQFYNDLELVGDEGHSSIFVDYDVVFNTQGWFTLKLNVNIEAGSGNRYFVYYNVNRNTGEIVKLADLFNTSDFNEILIDIIIEEMHSKMEEDSNVIYWTKDTGFGQEFASIDDRNFYFNEDGNLVIPFDKYEVAPGAMGCPEFVIEIEDIKDIMIDDFEHIKP